MVRAVDDQGDQAAQANNNPPAPTTEKGPARLIKRYANRKLYDTLDSRYVTLQQIAEFVRAGDDVQIVDNKTKDDLTSVTLAQIIYEEEKNSTAPKKRSVRSLKAFIEGALSSTGIQGGIHDLQEGWVEQQKRLQEGLHEQQRKIQTGFVEQQKRLASSLPAPLARFLLNENANDPDVPAAEHKGESNDAAREKKPTRNLLHVAVSHVEQMQTEIVRLRKKVEDLEVRFSRDPKDE